MLKVILFCIYSTVFNLVIAQVQEGIPCETPREEYGLCINIYKCEALLNLVKTQGNDPSVRNYLRSSQCGFSGSVPIVCCPQAAGKSLIPFDVPTNDNDKTQETATTEKPLEPDLPKLLSPPDCGFSNETHPRVVGGVPAHLDEFPWIVALGYRNSANPKVPKWLCGGSLITYRHILTAAHCVHNRKDLYLARLGELDLYDPNDGASPEDIELERAKIHENYSPVQFTNDIAILTMKRTPTNNRVWPICLPHADPLRSTNLEDLSVFITGWGAVYFDGPSSSSLQVAEIKVMNTEKCKKVFGKQAVIDDRIICAGLSTAERDSCKGDSGGPLMIGKSERENLRYHQVGIVSYGYRCAEPGYPGVYTRVTQFVDWIRRNIN